MKAWRAVFPAAIFVFLASTLASPDTGPTRAIGLGAPGEGAVVEWSTTRVGTSAAEPEVSGAIAHDTSEPLRSLPILPAPEGWMPLGEAAGGEAEGLPPGPARAQATADTAREPDGTDPAWTQPSRRGPIPGPVRSFDGITQAQQLQMGYWAHPADPNGDVGPDHYVQVVNVSMAVYAKSGALLWGPGPINTVWLGFGGVCETAPGAITTGDPIVLYDEMADRWMLSQFSMPNYPAGPYYECIAVSQTGNPMGAWYRYEFKMSENVMNDGPKFGVWPDGYYMNTNQFSNNASTWAGSRVTVFERNAMLAGANARKVSIDMGAVDPNLQSFLPADVDGPAPPVGSPAPFVEMDDTRWGYPIDKLQLWSFDTDWVTPANSEFTHTADIPTAPFDSDLCGTADCITQPNTSQKLDPVSYWLMYRLQYRNFGTHETLVTNHTVDVNGANRAGIRWYELRNSGTGWDLHDQGSFSPSVEDRWSGSAAMDAAGGIAVSYNLSGGSTEPSIAYAGRIATDPAGELAQGEAVLQTGGGHQTSVTGRWGDYSSMSVDPVDGCRFWFTNMYYASTSQDSWRTRIGAFRLPSCGTPSADVTPPTGVSVTAPETRYVTGAVDVAWTATDVDSGIDSYDVLVRKAVFNGAFGPDTAWLAGTQATTGSYGGSPGHVYCFSLIATDGADNVASSPGAQDKCVMMPVDDVGLSIQGRWKRASSTGAYRGTVTQSSTVGDRLVLPSAQAKQVRIMVIKCPTCGVVKVWWNGTVIGRLRTKAAVKTARAYDLPAFASLQTGLLTLEVVSGQARIDGVGLARQ